MIQDNLVDPNQLHHISDEDDAVVIKEKQRWPSGVDFIDDNNDEDSISSEGSDPNEDEDDEDEDADA